MRTAVGFLIVPILAAVPAFGNTLTFPNNICSANTDGSGALTGCSDYSYINQAYGDAPDVNVTYVDLVNIGNSLRWWDTDYNNLQGVAWGGNGDGAGQSWDRIEISPVGGVSITLTGFDIGAYPNTQRSTHLQILDLLTNAVLLDYGAPNIGSGNVSSHFSPNATSVNGIAIEWKDSAYNVGIDNIDFSTSISAVPEPSTLFPLSALLLVLSVWIRRQRRSVHVN